MHEQFNAKSIRHLRHMSRAHMARAFRYLSGVQGLSPMESLARLTEARAAITKAGLLVDMAISELMGRLNVLEAAKQPTITTVEVPGLTDEEVDAQVAELALWLEEDDAASVLACEDDTNS